MKLLVPPLRTLVGVFIVLGAIALTFVFLFVPVPGVSRDAAIALLTLAWNNAGHIVRALFKSEDVAT